MPLPPKATDRLSQIKEEQQSTKEIKFEDEVEEGCCKISRTGILFTVCFIDNEGLEHQYPYHSLGKTTRDLNKNTLTIKSGGENIIIGGGRNLKKLREYLGRHKVWEIISYEKDAFDDKDIWVKSIKIE